MSLPSDAVPVLATIRTTWASPVAKAVIAPAIAKPNKIHLHLFATKFRYATKPNQLGYIKGKVTAKGVIAPDRRVVLLSWDWAFVAETFSDAFGNYRFDGLMLGRYYTVIAQDNDSYQYAPVSADRRKPEAYT